MTGDGCRYEASIVDRARSRSHEKQSRAQGPVPGVRIRRAGGIARVSLASVYSGACGRIRDSLGGDDARRERVQVRAAGRERGQNREGAECLGVAVSLDRPSGYGGARGLTDGDRYEWQDGALAAWAAGEHR